MGDISIKGRSARANYRHGGRTGFDSGKSVKVGGISRLTGDTGGVKEIFPGMGITGGASGKASSKASNRLFKNFKKKINKTPDKQIPKTQKKAIIKQEMSRKNKWEATGDKWSPFAYGAKAKGGRV